MNLSNSTVAFEAEAPTHVRREVELPAPVAEVWASLTEPERFGRWFGAVEQMKLFSCHARLPHRAPVVA